MRHVLLVGALALIGCGATNQPATGPATAPALRHANVGEDIRIPVRERVGVPGAQIVVAFDSVLDDSRCPMNARCVWAGNAKLAFALTKYSAMAANTEDVTGKSFELNTSDRFPQRHVHEGFDIVLVNLEPTPMTGEPVAQYVATVRVEPRR